MTRLFKGFHLDGVADSLPPVAALSVYQEFRELTPPGKEGDRVINKLVDRLVMADLLEEAVELMNYQIKFRASGERKAAAGARLAQILLMDRNPENAIKALTRAVFEIYPRSSRRGAVCSKSRPSPNSARPPRRSRRWRRSSARTRTSCGPVSCGEPSAGRRRRVCWHG